ncbi:hypothetical protein BGZ80_000219 [Entomortierella chlamydospora]|uniref:FAD-binding domain-containing protein n=1 Tax=Entomortierella chlamydospora TaxID=101097 RepID=A0A9P6N3R9_9FUNG|nr:hypothetical protein BGZ79_010459 [Entomortierella chlamydospora]KAG0022447.1 hypothetical protein BGZ80_000219 [Entomortierella chlamydospora]
MGLHPPPKVLIAGGGIGGLFLAILLEKAGIPYHVYERAPFIRPLGALMTLNANILPAFDQLGLLEPLAKISRVLSTVQLYKESLKLIGTIDVSGFKEKTGYDYFAFSRPDLYDLLISQVPVEKISFNKKVVWLLQNDEGVMIRTSDNETYHGDILVGADGAHSAVRQNLYKHLAKKNELPACDSENLKAAHICMVGTTVPLDPEIYPELKDEQSRTSTIIGRAKAHTWVTTTLSNNRISYSVTQQLDYETAKNALFRNSEWSPESNMEMIKEIYNFPVKNGSDGSGGRVRTLGDLIDATPPEHISKVFIEEKLFETWYGGRTVLIGDACHKMQPSGGQGAVNAMEDAIILANCLYDISDGKVPVTSERITDAFRDYREQRYAHAKFQVENSQDLAKILTGQTFAERLTRTVMYNLPKWIVTYDYLKQMGYRPQIMFMPTVPDPPNLRVYPQKPSKRYLAEQAERNNNSSIRLEM